MMPDSIEIPDNLIVAIAANVLLIAFLLLIVRPIYEYYWYMKLRKAMLRSLDEYLEQYSQKLAKKVLNQVEVMISRKLREGLQEWRPSHDQLTKR